MQHCCVNAQDSEIGPRSVWIVTDGRLGNLNPARALARALQTHGWEAAQERTAMPRAWAARLPAGLWAALGAREGGWPFTGLADRGAGLARPWPGLAIGAGRRAAPAVAALRRLGGVRAVQILDPGLDPGRFDLVAVPSHDRLRGGNVLTTLGSLSVVTPAAARTAAAEWPRPPGLPKGPLAAVLLGGPSRSARFGAAEGRAVVAAVSALAARFGVLVTPSRRTPAGLAAAVAEGAPGAWVWDGTGPNPYPAILGLAEIALVTADSANMVCEAASAGLPVLVTGLEGVSGKLRRLHGDLQAGGFTRIFEGTAEVWPAPGLDEAGWVGAEVARRLAGGA